MKVINCPNCGEPVTINIVNAIDENGEVFACPECGYHFRYTDN